MTMMDLLHCGAGQLQRLHSAGETCACPEWQAEVEKQLEQS